MSQINDIGISADQIHKLLSLLQNQNKGNQTSSNAVVTVANSGMKPAFKDSVEVHNEGRFIPTIHVNAVLYSQPVWILDSGATHHITCSLEYFEICHRTQGISVKLPNGETVCVTHIGQIRLNKNVVLQNVLYIPSFAFNIISVSRLTKQSGYKIVKEVDYCTVQGPLGTMVGFAREQDGLYLINEPPIMKKDKHADRIDEIHCNSLTVQLWHNRLGHYHVLKIPSLNGIKHGFLDKNCEFMCEACHFAKHRRSTFPVSTSKAANCFELVHMDVWVLLLWLH